MTHRIGIMQGRLSPMVDGKIQTFPSATWRQEFAQAAACGCELLEWVFDEPDWAGNPLMSEAGRREITALQREHSVEVPSVCADYFMSRPLTSPDAAVRAEARDVLADLIAHAPSVGARLLELPLIGPGSLGNPDAAASAVELFRSLAPALCSSHVSLLLELDLGPLDIAALFSRIDTSSVFLNYDTGNSAYWGFDPVEEFAAYGRRIRNVHIKDVTREEYSVPLGQGHVDFDLSFSLLKQAGYAGDFILQAARGDDHMALARRFVSFTRGYVDRYFG